jgi:hypothetical protein
MIYQSIMDPKFNEGQVTKHLFILSGNQHFDHGNINQLNIFWNIARNEKIIYDQRLGEWIIFGVTMVIFARCIVLISLWQKT